MESKTEVFKILGPTYLIRFYLSLCGCSWNGVFWSTCDPNLKLRLKKIGLADSNIKALRLEKIKPKKSVDSSES